MINKRHKLLAVICTLILFTVLFSFRTLIIPKEWSGDFTLNCVLTILQELLMTALFVLLSAKIFNIKIHLSKKNLVKGIFWYGLVDNSPINYTNLSMCGILYSSPDGG